MSIGTNIKRRRFELNISQQELALKLGYKTRSTIAKIEADENSVSTKKLTQFAKALDTTVEALISGIDKNFVMAPEIIPNSNGSKNIVVIQAGGKSTRNQQNVPNQFINVLGKPVIMYTIEAYQRHPAIHEIYIVCLKGWEQIVISYCEQYGITKLQSIIPGGESGVLSVKNSIDGLRNKLNANDTIIFQEANRPLVTDEMISKLLWHAQESGSAITVEPMNDYLQFLVTNSSPKLIDRNSIVCMQSPEAYNYGSLTKIFQQAENARHPFTESCLPLFLYNMGFKLNFYEGTHNNIKILRQEDVAIFTALLRMKIV